MSYSSISDAYTSIMAEAKIEKLQAIDIEKRYLGKSLIEELDNDKFFISEKKEDIKIDNKKSDTIKDRIKTNWQKLISPITDFIGLFKSKKNKNKKTT